MGGLGGTGDRIGSEVLQGAMLVNCGGMSNAVTHGVAGIGS